MGHCNSGYLIVSINRSGIDPISEINCIKKCYIDLVPMAKISPNKKYVIFYTMNSKIAIAISVFAAVLMLLPGVSLASPMNSNVHQYQVGNEKVVFDGKQIFVGFGNRTEKVQWRILSIDSNVIHILHFQKGSVNRIKNGAQNSAVFIEENSLVKVAEIFTFHRHSLDASIAIKNLAHNNMSFEAIFSLASHQNKFISFKGFGISKSVELSNYQMSNIPGSAWAATMGNLQVNWAGETSLLQMGTVARNNSMDSLSLPFGPIQLIRNETYTIDPVIEPLMPTPCPSCGGGGGGSTGPTSPSVSSESISQQYVGPGQSTSIGAYVNTGGSATVNFEFYQFGTWNSAYSEYETTSTTYSHTFSYTQLSENQVTAMRIMATNSAGTSYGPSKTVDVYYYAPASRNFVAYNASGGEVASATLGITVPGWSGTFSTLGPAPSGSPNSFNMNFGTATEWNKNDIAGVWNITQNIYGYSPNYQGTGQVFGLGTVRYAQQTTSNDSFLVNLADYIVGIANSFAFGIIPSPSYFANSGGTTTPIDVASYSPPEDSSSPVYISTGCGCGAGYFYYPSIQYGSILSSHSSKIWGVKSVSDYFTNGYIPDYLGVVVYNVNLNFVVSNDYYTLDTYGLPCSLMIGVNVQTVGG